MKHKGPPDRGQLGIVWCRRIVLVVLTGGCAARPTRPAAATAPVSEIVGASEPAAPLAVTFGSWNEDRTRFELRSRFPQLEGQPFGWRIKTRCTGPVKFREVMQLPAAGDWTLTPEEMPGTTISADQTTTTTIDYAACKAGWVEHGWSLAAGDPAGTYVITVELDGHTPQTFRPTFVTASADRDD